MSAKAIRLRRVVFALMLVAAALPSSWAEEAYLRPWPKGMTTPSLKLNDPGGQEWTSQSLRGKVVVLNFWATWCAPCVDEIPFLNELASKPSMAGKVIILGVNFKESATTIRRFADAHGFQYPVLMDKSGEQFRKWTSGVLPTTVLIDRNGRARWRIVGELDRTDTRLQDALEKMLDEPERNRIRPGAK